jgi:chromosome partitioning protein
MLHVAPLGSSWTPHVIVVGNEKGGSGKTTIAMHVATGLLKSGQRVGTIDLDSNQKSLTHYIDNRRVWANYRHIELEMPVHRCLSRAEGSKLDENEAQELAGLQAIIASFDGAVDFIVVDTPASDTYLMRVSHLVADTLLTPLNDSFLDFGALAATDPITHEVTGLGHYAQMVCQARRNRWQFDRGQIDWVVIHNRLSRSRLVQDSISQLAMTAGFRALEGCAERSLYRQLFPIGLTSLDRLDKTAMATRPNASHRAAEQEVYALLEGLRLQISDRRRRQAAAHAEWLRAAGSPLETDDIFAA